MTDKDTAENFDTNAEQAAEQEAAGKPGLNGSASPANTAAKMIMADPAAAAAEVATPQVMVQRTLEILPGLVGAVDHAIKDQTGKHQPFVLLIFAEGTALHSANFAPDVAKSAVIELAKRWDEGEPVVQVNPGDEAPSSIDAVAGGADEAANDGGPPHVTH